MRYEELGSLGAWLKFAGHLSLKQRHVSSASSSMIYQPPPSFRKKIGELLIEANLLTPAQVEVALYDQQQFSTMKLGEIFVFRGWLNQKTADFFGDQWRKLCSTNQNTYHSLGDYLCAAGLMDHACVEKIIEEQSRNGYRFGANAVLLGFIDQKTLDFFLENLFPDRKQEGHYVFNGKQRIMQPQSQVNEEIQVKPPAPSEDISWVG